ncbi:MAG: response regulator [Desulfotomaculales bacterium]
MGRSVLIVDDSAAVRGYFAAALHGAGFTVDEAANGYEALEKAYNGTYDLFLVDINMPKMTGYDFVRQLRSNESAFAPVVMISTEAGAEDREEAYKSGANAYLVKPVRAEVLLMLAKLLTGWEKESNAG